MKQSALESWKSWHREIVEALGGIVVERSATLALVKDLKKRLRESNKDYSDMVDKFDECRAALAYVYDKITGKNPIHPEDNEQAWHDWIIQELERVLKGQGSDLLKRLQRAEKQ